MELVPTLHSLGIALGLGLLVGLQRQRIHARVAGVRTFPLATMLGTVCGLLAQPFGGWVVGLGLLALAALLVLGNVAMLRSGEVDPGQTTEVAMLLMFGVGAYLVIGHREVAIALGGGVAVLLWLKEELHDFAGGLGEQDFRAIMQFALLSLVILPVLPDRTYGPYDVLNPREVWWMVVLIVGIGLAAYIGYKLLGERTGTLLAGLLGGAVSSTATTVAQARRAAREPATAGAAAAVITLASGVVFVRVLIEIAVVAPGFLPAAAGPLGAMLAVFAVLALVVWLRAARRPAAAGSPDNPSELRSALVFGALYALVLLAVAAAERHFGNRGLYAVGALSGLTDLDAITLSTANLVDTGRLVAATGWRVVVVAALSNLLFKTAVVAVLGGRRLLLRIAAIYAVALAAGGLILALWPG